MHKFTFQAAALALGVFPLAAQAGPIVAASCNSVASPAGCLFQGNINSNPNPANVNGYKNAEALYNLFNDTHPSAGPDITLNYLFDTDTTAGLITGVGSAAGTWSIPGYYVNFFAVKAGPSFVLYKIAQATSGTWDTFDIPHGANPRELSHIVFFGGAVPEPAAWGMMIGGFGLAGAAVRRRKAKVQTKLA
ncbi:PEP-CTERM sorting domain-containing protein [Sphingomonas sp. JC676]|uniref:PEPxxWA-CTERM sorting domain-containing protein n=1 Tax=Sphingomonas sp. JC676 TaxID=2768065 RepID=UPI0016581A75|nr:PEPxxWA-CTERM sorting domain-containing protein [Sphingomonas sp. JC676]MBC9031423.1 PEP-CTERM sorting domain-containing protein [Sphingomonas sp. JC676]